MGIALLFVAMSATFFLVGMPAWGWFIAAIAVVLGAFELYLHVKHRQTLSSRFYHVWRTRSRAIVVVGIVFAIVLGLLIYHLLGYWDGSLDLTRPMHGVMVGGLVWLA